MAEDSSVMAPDGTPLTEPEVEETDASTETPSVESLAQTVETLSQRLHDSQAKITELGTANSELRGQLSVIAQPKEAPVEREDPYAGLDEDEVLTNPMLIVQANKRANDLLVGDLAEVLREMKSEMVQGFQANDPERRQYAAVIGELKKDPDLADLPEAVLLKMARRQARIAPATLPDPAKPKGVPGGGGRTVGQPTSEDIRKSPLFNAIYGDQ